MENTKHLSLDYGNLRKGKPTLKFKNELAQNLIYCYNLYRDKNELFKFYSNSFYGVFKDQGVVRQLSSNLVDMSNVIKLVNFNNIFKDMLDFEVNSNKKITLKETMHILDKYLYNNFDNFNHNYHKNRLKK